MEKNTRRDGSTTSRDRGGNLGKGGEGRMSLEEGEFVDREGTNDRYLHSSGTGCVIALAARKFR